MAIMGYLRGVYLIRSEIQKFTIKIDLWTKKTILKEGLSMINLGKHCTSITPKKCNKHQQHQQKSIKYGTDSILVHKISHNSI